MTKEQTEQPKKEEPVLTIVNMDKILYDRRHSPRSPWKRARYLEDNRIAETTSLEDVARMLNEFDNPRDKALFAILYLCGARVEEIVRHTPITYGKTKVILVKNHRSSQKWIADHKKKKYLAMQESIKKSDIKIDNQWKENVLTFRIRNLKNRQPKERVKVIPFIINNEFDRKLKQVIDTYLAGLDMDDELFPITKRRAEQILEVVKVNPHFLRKLRLTHLVRYYNFSDQKLKVFAGWSDSRPSKEYIKIGLKDLIDSM